MENILWNTWQYLVDVFDCFLILYLFRKMMRTRLRQPKYYYLFLPVLAAVLFACNCWCPHTRFAGQKNNLYNGKG